jgi:hypothetical protein
MNKELILGFIKRYPTALISAFVALSCLIYIFGRGDLTTELEAEEASLSSRMTKLDANNKNAVNLAGDVEGVEVLVEKIRARLFDSEQRAVNTNFFYTLEEIVPIRINGVSQTQVSVPSLTVNGGKPLELYDTMGYDVIVEGSYPDIILLMNEFSRVSPFIRILGVQMSIGTELKISGSAARIRIAILAKKNS